MSLNYLVKLSTRVFQMNKNRNYEQVWYIFPFYINLPLSHQCTRFPAYLNSFRQPYFIRTGWVSYKILQKKHLGVYFQLTVFTALVLSPN